MSSDGSVGKSAQFSTENHAFLDYFVKWLQKLEFGQKQLHLKRVKSNLTNSKKIYVTLSEKGKNVKQTDPVKVSAKVQRTGESTVGFEIVDTFTKRKISFYSNQTDFPYDASSLDDPKFQKSVEKFTIEPYSYDIIAMSGSGYKSNPYADDSPIVDTIISKHNPNGTRLKSQSPPIEIESIPSSSPRNTSLEDFEFDKSLAAQLLLTQFVNENLSIQITQLTKVDKPDFKRFNINDFTVQKTLLLDNNRTIFGVEHLVTKQRVSISEIIQISYTTDQILLSKISRELDLLKQIKNLPSYQSKEHLLHVLDISIEPTPIRTSYYIVSEPIVFTLEDLIPKVLKSSNKIVVCIITTQILSGLSSLKEEFGKIHGNLTPGNILIDFKGNIQLSFFENSFQLNTLLDPKFLLTGKNDLLYKHPFVFECKEHNAPLMIKPNLDLWSLGCIVHKLINGTDVFKEDMSFADHVTAFQNTIKPTDMAYGLFTRYEINIDPTQLLTTTFQEYKNMSILNYIQN